MNSQPNENGPERRGNDDTGPGQPPHQKEVVVNDDTMAPATDSGPRPNYSRARRRHILALIRRERVLDIAPAGRIVYVVGALIADDHGYLPEASLHAALRDPSIVQAARELLRKATV